MNELESFFNLNSKNAVAAPATVFIYGLNDPVTGKCRYVGKTSHPRTRLTAHVYYAASGKTHRDAWIRGLKEAGLRPTLEIIDEVLKTEWEFWEREYLRVFRMIGINLTNLTDGGEGSVGLTERSIEKIREAKRGKVCSPETRAKIRAGNLGKKLTPETCAKMSASRLGRPLSTAHRQSISRGNTGSVARKRLKTFLGKRHSEAAKLKNREAHLGKTASLSTRQKMSLAQLKRYGK